MMSYFHNSNLIWIIRIIWIINDYPISIMLLFYDTFFQWIRQKSKSFGILFPNHGQSFRVAYNYYSYGENFYL